MLISLQKSSCYSCDFIFYYEEKVALVYPIGKAIDCLSSTEYMLWRIDVMKIAIETTFDESPWVTHHVQVAYRLVQSLATRSCSSRCWVYCVAILPTRGSAGLQSVSKEQIDSRTLETVRAGLQLSFKMSKQMTPWLLMLQWYIRVLKVTCFQVKEKGKQKGKFSRLLTFGGLNGYSGEKWISKKNTPPS